MYTKLKLTTLSVYLTNDGPVTILLDTDDSGPSKQSKNPHSNKSIEKKQRLMTKNNKNQGSFRNQNNMRFF